MDWSRPRQRYGLAIKDSRGKLVSDYNNWRWNGANPKQWYPLDMCFTVVVVAKGAKFSGWQNYGGRTSDNELSDAAGVVEVKDLPAEEGDLIVISDDGELLEFGSGMEFETWESESTTDDPEIDDDAGDAEEAMDNKLYLPMIAA